MEERKNKHKENNEISYSKEERTKGKVSGIIKSLDTNNKDIEGGL